MNWVNPGLSYLFFLIGLIYIIYLLKRKKIKYSFSSLLLWEDFEIHETSRSQFKRFLPDLLFWIHLLILILLILSLLRPQMIFNERDRERKIIIIDRSASMQAEDVEPDRFEVSRQKIIDYINELESGREIALVSAAAEPEVIHEFTSSRQELIEVVEELQVTDTAINPEECIESALSLADDSGELVFFTDSSFPDINYQKQNPLEIKQTGTEADNLGITDIDIKPAGKDEVYQVMIQVGNFTSESRQVPVKIEDQNNDIISEKTLDIESEEIESTIFKLDLNSEMILKLFLDIEDDALTLDNKAWLTTGDKDPLQVLLVGPDPDFFLENALNTNDKIDLVTRENIVGKESEEFDLVIYDDIFAPVMTGGNTFFINRFPANYREYIQEGRVSEKIGEWDRGNTLFKHIDINNLKIKEFNRVNPPPRSQILMSGEDNPLIISYEEPEWKWLYTAFKFKDTNLPLSSDFPVLIDNILQWFFPAYFNLDRRLVKAGNSFTFRTEVGNNIDSVINPEEEKIELKRNNSNFSVDTTTTTGIYQLETDNGNRTPLFAVNMQDANESRINPVSQTVEFQTGETDLTEVTGDLWPYFLLIVLFLLILEWYIFYEYKGG